MADTLRGGIVINEVLVDPNSATLNFDTDGNGTATDLDEYIDLYNSSNIAIDISGLQLWDGGVGRWFTFPSGTILAPGGHAMVMAGVQGGGQLPTGGPNDLFFNAGRGVSVINNAADNLVVYDPANNQFIQATFNGAALDNPTAGGGGYSTFPATATRSGLGENFGTDVDGQSIQRQGDGSNIFGAAAPTPGTTNICFVAGAMILTPAGMRPVESLRAGDPVMTVDRGVQRVTWVCARTWPAHRIAAEPRLAAVRIGKGALGDGLPLRDLCLSQQHRLLVSGPIARRMFGTDEVLVPANAFLDLPGVALDPPDRDVTYLHVMLPRHEILIAEGVPGESLYLGAEALRSIPPASLDELLVLLGMTQDEIIRAASQAGPARLLVRRRPGSALVRRHLRNGRPLCARPVHSAAG